MVREVRDTLLEEYDVEAERCEKDLIALLQELAKNDLIDIVDNVKRASFPFFDAYSTTTTPSSVPYRCRRKARPLDYPVPAFSNAARSV